MSETCPTCQEWRDECNAKAAEIERLKGVVDYLSDSWRKDEAVHRELRAALNRNKIETQYMNGVLEAFPRHDHPLYVESQALDARISQLEEAVRVLGEVQKNARRYVYESSRFEPDNIYQVKLKAAVDAVLANPVAAKAVDVQT